MGRTPTPPGLKLLRHPAVGRGAPPAVANVPWFLPDRPPGMDEHEAWMWDAITPTLQRCKLLHEGVVPALMATCEAWSRYRRLRARFDMRFDTDEPMSIAQLDVAERNMRTWLTSWGLTAASEQVLTAAAAEIYDRDDPFAGEWGEG